MMLEELHVQYSAITTRNYLRVVTEFASTLARSPTSSAQRTRTYQAYLLTERKLTPGRGEPGSGAALLFVKTLKRHQFRDFLPYPRTGAGCRRC